LPEISPSSADVARAFLIDGNASLLKNMSQHASWVAVHRDINLAA